MKNKELEKYIQKEIEEILKNKKIYMKIRDLFNYYEERNKDLSLLLDNNLKKQFQQKTKYTFLISLLSVFEKEDDFLTSLKDIENSFCVLKADNENEEFLCSGIEMLINFIDENQITDKYDIIFNTFYIGDSEKQPNNCQQINKVMKKWLLNKILNDDNINMKDLFSKIQKNYQTIIKECIQEHNYNFIYTYLFKIASNKTITKHEFVELYPLVLKKLILTERKKNTLLCYSVFYFTFLYKYYKNQIRFENLKKIKLQVIKNNQIFLYLDVHCIFFYLYKYKELKKIISENKIKYISQILKEIKNNQIKIVNPFNNRDLFSFSQDSELQFLKIEKIIALIKSDKKFTNNLYYTINKVKTTLQKVENYSHTIFYFVFHKNINSSIILNLSRIEGNKYYFKLKGIFITDHNSDKYVLLYNKYTNSWNCLGDDEKWKTLEVHSLELVYFKKHKKNQKENLLQNISVDAQPKDQKINELYKESLSKIYSINPSFINSNKLYVELDVKKTECSSKQGYDINLFYKGNIFNDDEILQEELEQVLKQNTPIIQSENEELIEWIIEKGNLNKNNNISLKLAFYICIIHIFQKNKTDIDEMEKLLYFNNKILSEQEISNLKHLSQIINFQHKLSISELLEIFKTSENSDAFLIIQQFLEIIILILHNHGQISNISLTKINQLLENESSLTNPMLMKFVCNNLYDYLTKKFINSNGSIPLLDEIIVQLIDKINKLNGEHISLITKYINCHFKDIIIYKTFLYNHTQRIKKLYQLLYTNKKQYVIADILMFAVKFFQIDKTISYEILDFYKEIKEQLRKDFYLSNTEPILKLSIIIFFSFIKNYKLEEKFNQLKIIPIEKQNVDNFFYIYLILLFLKPKIHNHLETNKTSVNPWLIEIFQLIKQKNKKFDDEIQVEQLIKKIKETKVTLDEIFAIPNIKIDIKEDNINNMELKEPFPCIIFQKFKKSKWNGIESILDKNKKINLNHQDIYYELIGILILEEFQHKKEIDTLIYNKYNNQWYSVNNKTTQYTIDNNVLETNMKAFILMYTKKTKDRLKKEINISFVNSVLKKEDSINFSLSQFNYYESLKWLQDKQLFNIESFTESIQQIYSSEPTVQKDSASYCMII